MTESFAEWLYLLALIAPPTVVVLGIVALMMPRFARKTRLVAERRSHAHA